LKKEFLQVTRSPAEVELMRRLKQVLDPAQLLNPGRIFDQNEGDIACNAEPSSPA
jgi:FAD/FMN-containing dehydrogenase